MEISKIEEKISCLELDRKNIIERLQDVKKRYDTETDYLQSQLSDILEKLRNEEAKQMLLSILKEKWKLVDDSIGIHVLNESQKISSSCNLNEMNWTERDLMCARFTLFCLSTKMYNLLGEIMSEGCISLRSKVKAEEIFCEFENCLNYKR